MFLSNSATYLRKPVLFDIRMRGVDNDVLLIKGPPSSAPSVLLAGTIVLSILDPIQIKSFKLALIGKLTLNIPTTVQTTKGSTTKYNRYERRFFQHYFDNIDIESYVDNLNDGSMVSSKSSGNISGLRSRSKSTASLASLGSLTGSSNRHTLQRGNYEFPFSVILPGSLEESVEGINDASVTYYLEANVERHKQTDLTCRKVLRVVRTMASDAVEISETTAVDNTWPNKVDYSISVPTRAVAIGSTTPIDISLVPSLKGLRLGPIKISLLEYIQFCGSTGGVIHQERIVNKLKLKDPLGHVAILKRQKEEYNEEESEQEELLDEFQDRWEVSALFNIPANLSKCCQDCNILTSLKVRHKLKFVISLINPDGHISELRATLPLNLFISPFVALTVQPSDEIEKNTRYGSNIGVTENSGNEEELIFAKTSSELELPALANGVSNNMGPMGSSINGLMAPPKYSNHVFDRRWGEHNTDPSNSTEGTNGSCISQNNETTDASPTLNINGLGISRPLSPVNGRYLPSPITDSEEEDEILISTPRLPAEDDSDTTALLTPGFISISRKSSINRQKSPTPNKNEWEIETMSRVPSYQNAMKVEVIEDDLPPCYPKNLSKNNKEMTNPISLHQRSNSSLLGPMVTGRTYSFQNRSNNSSSVSLQMLSENSTPGSLKKGFPSNTSLSSKNNIANKQVPFMTALSKNSSPSISQLQRDRSNSRLSAKDRSSSFASFIEIFSKRDRN
ncbi:hypothetical protein NCAS_0A08970 [Naumovozyma castellii]|uniref:Arrestin C-terminal-like domain-containing protein n=1 Tax=Naumovozyma castellii TaxID=27288 RepID=G0V7K7_NAUCA|nr:hypothetical protein NCAS_0A08970 [Naumovozyma castellii CBS 4309]CCC67455.1 hypothetical protein NCAS_0A08970 [Naumovozyma castellii CBS 4309]